MAGNKNSGRPKKPIEISLLNGNKGHLTKSEIEERKKEEFKLIANKNEIVPPEYMPSDLCNKFYYIAGKLFEAKIFTELDVDCLAKYLIEEKLYITYTKKLGKAIENNELDAISIYQGLQSKTLDRCRVLASDLGLTISSRCKLVVPQPPEKPPKNKFEKFKLIKA